MKYEIKKEYFIGATLVDTSKEYIPQTEWEFINLNEFVEEIIEETTSDLKDLSWAADITNQIDKACWAITITDPVGKEVFYKSNYM